MSDQPQSTEEWVPTVPAAGLDEDYPTMVKVGGVEVALCRIDDEVFAIGNICTHAFARLSEGFVEDGKAFCPLHQGAFDVRTGKAVAEPCTVAVMVYPIKLVGGVVHVSPFGRMA